MNLKKYFSSSFFVRTSLSYTLHMYVNNASVFLFAMFPVLCHMLIEVLVYTVERISDKSSFLAVSFFSAFSVSQLFRQLTGVFTDILEGLTLIALWRRCYRLFSVPKLNPTNSKHQILSLKATFHPIEGVTKPRFRCLRWKPQWHYKTTEVGLDRSTWVVPAKLGLSTGDMRLWFVEGHSAC